MGGGNSNSDAAVASLTREIDPSRIRTHVETLASFGPRCDSQPEGLAPAIEYLTSTLAASGYSVQKERCTHSLIQSNLVVERRGGTAPDTVIEIGAHYDTVPGSPGSDDNGSGVGGLLEIARVLRYADCGRTVRLCFFGLEEEGRRSGSFDHVALLETRPAEQHLGILVFEMIGYCRKEAGSQRAPIRIPGIFWPPDTGNFICVIANLRSAGIATRFERAARRFVPELRIYAVKRLGALLQDAARSDHVPYWRAKRRGVMITDTANFRNPHYHKASDTPDTLDYEFCTLVTRATAATMLKWAATERASRFETAG
jgi:Zn-dependent M28 family amino/carboxypeptidase